MKKVIVKFYDDRQDLPRLVKEYYDDIPEGWLEMTADEYNDLLNIKKQDIINYNKLLKQDLIVEAEQAKQAAEQAKAQEDAAKQAEFEAFLAWKAAQAGE